MRQATPRPRALRTASAGYRRKVWLWTHVLSAMRPDPASPARGFARATRESAAGYAPGPEAVSRADDAIPYAAKPLLRPAAHIHGNRPDGTPPRAFSVPPESPLNNPKARPEPTCRSIHPSLPHLPTHDFNAPGSHFREGAAGSRRSTR